MKTTKEITTKTEEVLSQVVSVTDKLYGRVETIDFSVESLSATALEDMKLHLGYTKNFSDLAKVRLQYLKYGDK